MQIGSVWPRKSDVREALEPLWDDGTIQVLQLTVEHAFRGDLGPGFTTPLRQASERGDLVGHAVHSSPLTSPRDLVSVDWLARAKKILARWPVRFVTDHFGCCRSEDWHAAPLPLPASNALVAAGREHLQWMSDELEIPVGLENLALAMSVDDVLWQPDLLDAMIRPVDGLLLLDLHNLWCSAVNYRLDPVALLERYPLDLVRQIHIAGGSWSDFPEGRFRRDTHDGPVPAEVWALLPEAIGRCENLEVVVLERLRGTLEDPEEVRREIRQLAALAPAPPTAAFPLPKAAPWTGTDPAGVRKALFRGLRNGNLAELERVAPNWASDSRALRVAAEITEKWGRPVPT